MLILLAATLVACGGEAPAASTPVPTTPPQEGLPAPVTPAPTQDTSGQPERVSVQHILIGFKDAVGFGGSPPEKAATRTQEQAKTLAYDLLARAKAGEDFDKLVADNTDDSPPGIYSMSNNGISPSFEGELPRGNLVAAFGDVGFTLEMNEIGIADYDPQASPFGYHIIKRVGQPPTPTPETKPAGQDDRITVQHILIGFQEAVGFRGNVPPKAQGRTQEAAKTLAYEILDRAKKGEDYDKLVAEYTDDQAPGTYSLANSGVPTATAEEYSRRNMVAAFGNVGFGLKVGEIGIADYDPETSPFGYHVIKRVK